MEITDAIGEVPDGSPASRHLPLRGTYNVRDVGGYPADGGAVRWRTLLRADALHLLDDAGRAELAGLGLRTVIDLREDVELETAPDALDGVGATILRNPVFGQRFFDLPADLQGIYDVMVEDCGPTLAAAVAELCEPGALPALVHCTAGKDRTGLVIALTLSVAGVADDEIVADYVLSNTYLGSESVDHLRAASGLGEGFRPTFRYCGPELILGALDRIRAEHGGVVEYLLAHGLTEAQLSALRATLVA